MSSLAEDKRTALLESLPDRDADELLYDWDFWARPNQRPPRDDWRVWLILAGRGFGKTRIGAEWTRAAVRTCRLVNIIGATVDDARDIMIEGESGILAICPPSERPVYKRAERQLAWPNGAKTLIFTADEPDRLRGKQHMKLWGDEPAAWRYPDAYDQAMLGLRLGPNPQAVLTTTPRPKKWLLDLQAAPTTAVTRGTTYENRGNLAPAFFSEIITRYEGTRLGRQELLGEVLTDVPGALWKRDNILTGDHPDLVRVVVAIDPAGSASETSDETGIIVAGKGVDGRGYVLADRSCRLSPLGWASRAIAAFDEFKADRIVAEQNFGGEMVESNLRTVRSALPFTPVHASRGKVIRAEPIASLYEQRSITHCGSFPELEDQLCTWTPESGKSPDRLDALVWALTELLVVPEKTKPTWKML